VADDSDSPATPLLDKEIAVLRLVARGLSNNEIAAQLACSAYDVSNRLRTIFSKLGLTSRTQAALYALRHGLAALDEPDTPPYK